ncbi:MAG TPA: branched-chain amino acid ABC transporter substrate-binding protein, partial [Herpetosiphonaceae bacterium]|nr:branched-chain amino acid ABC transporter substrate-binding protein [Herpetosiphonaceae bacterium]
MKRFRILLVGLLLAMLTLAACGTPNTASPSTQQNTTAPVDVAPTEAPAETAAAAVETAAPAAETAAAAEGTTAPAAGGSGETIKIWSSLPRQGASKGQTDAVVNSIKMRLEEANYQVCDGKYTIQYEDKDDATAAAGQWDPAAETANAQAAVADPDVMVYIGTFNSGAAKLSMPILNQANLVMISPANTYTGLTKPGLGEPGEPEKYFPTGNRNYTRVVTADDVQGAAAAQWANDQGLKSVFILDDQEVYGVGVADVFEKKAKELGMEVVDRQGIDGSASDFRALATTINSKAPDLVYFGGIVDNNAGQLLKDIRSVGYQGAFMGPDGINVESMITGAGTESAEGMYSTQAGTPNDQLPAAGKDFLTNYEAKYGAAPESYGIYGYDAAGVALEALNATCTKDREAIRDAVF